MGRHPSTAPQHHRGILSSSDVKGAGTLSRLPTRLMSRKTTSKENCPDAVINDVIIAALCTPVTGRPRRSQGRQFLTTVPMRNFLVHLVTGGGKPCRILPAAETRRSVASHSTALLPPQ